MSRRVNAAPWTVFVLEYLTKKNRNKVVLQNRWLKKKKNVINRHTVPSLPIPSTYGTLVKTAACYFVRDFRLKDCGPFILNPVKK